MNFIIQENFPIFSQLRYNSSMSDLSQLFPQNLYHSYVIEGEPENTGVLLLEFLKEKGLIDESNSDLLFQTYEAFTIADSGEIKDWYSRSGISNNKRICIIATKFINTQAEQTLLKILEEPKDNMHFFVILPDASILASTILSRVHVLKIEKLEDIDLQKKVNSFLKLTPKERVAMVALIVKENKDENNSGKLRSYATSFVNELEKIYYQKFKKENRNNQIKFALEELQKSRGYLSSSGASVKMILEHLALVL